MSVENTKRQKIQDGYGAPYHRTYSVKFPAAMKESVRQAMAAVQKDINHFSPQLLARFEKTKGEAHQLAKDDEFQIHISGPWNGPVRVAEVNESSFRLVTLEGHLEAGEITFRLRDVPEGGIVFEIESWARSRDAVVDFVYDKIAIAKLAQTEMWTSFCQTFAGYACEACETDTEAMKKKLPEVNIITERMNKESGEWEQI